MVHQSTFNEDLHQGKPDVSGVTSFLKLKAAARWVRFNDVAGVNNVLIPLLEFTGAQNVFTISIT